MVDDHISECADGVVEAASVLGAETFGHRDLDTRDVVSVPDRLEHRVREAQVEQFFETELSEEMVDTEDLLLSN